MSAFPNPSQEPNTAEVLWKFTSFGFSLLSPNDQKDKIEQISEKLAAGVADVERLEGETEEDLRRKQFAELFNKAPVYTQVDLFLEFTWKFFNERLLCEAILLFRQLDSNEQQERMEIMLGRMWMGSEDVLLERLSEECEEKFRLRRFIKLCSRDPFVFRNFFRSEAEKWDLEALHMQASGNEEIEEIKQSRYAEYYLGLSIIWFKARWASDPKGLIHLIINKFEEGDHIIEKLVNETEEDFRLRRFKESFKQLQFSSQEKFVEDILELCCGRDAAAVARRRWPRGGARWWALRHWADAAAVGRPHGEEAVLSWSHAQSSRVTEKPPFALEFMKVKTPNLRVSGGAAATEGGGQGAITQAGQGASQ